MKPALLLIDLQKDYLALEGLAPAAGEVVEMAGRLLDFFRSRGLPVVHVITTVTRTPDNRMPHWKAAGKWMCEKGTPGHAAPERLAVVSGEAVIEKQFFSGFENPELARWLGKCRCDGLVLAGLHLHACVRSAALDGYARGFGVTIASDAVASDDPIHAAITRRYLSERAIRFAPAAAIVAELAAGGRVAEPAEMHGHRQPMDPGRVAWEIPTMGRAEIERCVNGLPKMPAENDAAAVGRRAEGLRGLAGKLLENLEPLAQMILADVGKPITMARGEVRRSAALLAAVADYAGEPLEGRTSSGARFRRCALGTVALLSPWNNPLAIPAGKLAPAVVYGNRVIWKPALPGSRIAERLLKLWREVDAEAPVAVVTGGEETARALAGGAGIDAITLSGSERAGQALAEIALRRGIPFQGELGGNNAAIVAAGADLAFAAGEIAAGAFGFAGQRCTANRRAIVMKSDMEAFASEVCRATRALVCGNPAGGQTIIGPVISREKREKVEGVIARCAGMRCVRPHLGNDCGAADRMRESMETGTFVYPAVIVGASADSEIVQEETFGPVLVIQEAESFEHALELCNGVRQGLVAAMFGGTAAEREAFLARARAGILKWDQSTVDADAMTPFGGWKCSGIGPAEHGVADRDFYTRIQAIYGT